MSRHLTDLFFERHGGVHPDGPVLARVGDSRRSGQEKSGREELQEATETRLKGILMDFQVEDLTFP